MVALFQELISSQGKVRMVEKNIMYQKVFGVREMNSKKMNHCLAQATDLVGKYMVYKYHSTNPISSEFALLRVFKKRGLSTFFYQLKNKIRDVLMKGEEKDTDYYNHQFYISELSVSYKNVRDKEMVNEDEEFKSLITNLDLFYLFSQLFYACQVLNTKRAINAPKYELPLIKGISEMILQTPYADLPEIQMHLNAYKMLDTNEEKYYEELKSRLFDSYAILPKHYALTLFKYLQNFCAYQINRGNNAYYSQYWEIAIYQLDEGVVKLIQLPNYKNLVTAGTMLAVLQKDKEFSAVNYFLHKHTDKLTKEFREEAQCYTKAYISFYKNDFSTVINNLLVEQDPLVIYKFKDLYYQVDARRLLIMNFFSTNNAKNFDKMCNNLGVFLADRKELISSVDVEKNRQFIKLVKKIFLVKNNFAATKSAKKKSLQKLQKEVEKSPMISDRTWLLKQVGYIE